MDFFPDESNFYASPQSVIGSRASEADIETDPEAESTRLYHLSHEASIKSMGLVCYLAGMFCFLFTIFGILAGLGIIKGNAPAPGTSPEIVRMIMWIGAAVWGFAGIVGLGFGFGLRRLQVWARWTGMVLLVLSFLYSLLMGLFMVFLIPGPSFVPVLFVLLVVVAVQAFTFYLLAIPNSGMVFSAEYHLVIEKTPGIICKSSLIVKILIGLVVALMVLLLIGVLAEAIR
jgi:hypothetical protein